MSDSDSSDVVGRDSPVRLVADSLSSSDDEDARVPRPKQSSHFGTGMVCRPNAPLPSDGRGGGREEERVSIEDTLTTGCYDEGELLDYDESLDMDSGAVKAKDSDADEDEVKVHVMGAIEEGEVSSDEEGEIKDDEELSGGRRSKCPPSPSPSPTHHDSPKEKPSDRNPDHKPETNRRGTESRPPEAKEAGHRKRREEKKEEEEEEEEEEVEDKSKRKRESRTGQDEEAERDGDARQGWSAEQRRRPDRWREGEGDRDRERREGSGGREREARVPVVCRHFLNGRCSWGRECRFLHASPGDNDPLPTHLPSHGRMGPLGMPPPHFSGGPPHMRGPLGRFPGPHPDFFAGGPPHMGFMHRMPGLPPHPHHPPPHGFPDGRPSFLPPHPPPGPPPFRPPPGAMGISPSMEVAEESEGWIRLRTVPTEWSSGEEGGGGDDLRNKIKRKRKDGDSDSEEGGSEGRRREWGRPGAADDWTDPWARGKKEVNKRWKKEPDLALSEDSSADSEAEVPESREKRKGGKEKKTKKKKEAKGRRKTREESGSLASSTEEREVAEKASSKKSMKRLKKSAKKAKRRRSAVSPSLPHHSDSDEASLRERRGRHSRRKEEEEEKEERGWKEASDRRREADYGEFTVSLTTSPFLPGRPPRPFPPSHGGVPDLDVAHTRQHRMESDHPRKRRRDDPFSMAGAEVDESDEAQWSRYHDRSRRVWREDRGGRGGREGRREGGAVEGGRRGSSEERCHSLTPVPELSLVSGSDSDEVVTRRHHGNSGRAPLHPYGPQSGKSKRRNLEPNLKHKGTEKKRGARDHAPQPLSREEQLHKELAAIDRRIEKKKSQKHL